jgi:hypothetical protein
VPFPRRWQAVQSLPHGGRVALFRLTLLRHTEHGWTALYHQGTLVQSA